MDKGILLIAIGRPYGEMAYNLALSIKLANPEVKIAVVSDQASLITVSQNNQKVFDEIIEPKMEDYLEGMQMNPFKLKTFMYDYSPFKETLYLDADTLFLNGFADINALFDILEDHEFVMQEVRRYTIETAEHSNTVWTLSNRKTQLLPLIWPNYKLDDDAVYPETNSSFVWFKKNRKMKSYFTEVKKLYKVRHVWTEKIGGFYPDELAFGIASAKKGVLSGIEGFKPIHFHWERLFQGPAESAKYYFFLGFAGGKQPTKLLYAHDRLVQSNEKKSRGQSFKFKMRNKIYFKK